MAERPTTANAAAAVTAPTAAPTAAVAAEHDGSGPVLAVHDLCKAFGAVRVADAVSLDLRPGEIHALIGPNGAGKSSLVAQIAGSLRPDSGTVVLGGRDVTRLGVAARARLGLGRSFQVSAVVPGHGALENVVLAVRGRRGDVFGSLRGWRGDAAALDEARECLARVGLATRAAVPADSLSHGERRRLELAMTLALEPKAFLLDEPMAGSGGEGAREMTVLLDGLRRSAPVLLVEHDMDIVFALADRVTVLVDGRVLASGAPAAIRADARVRAAYLGDAR